MVFGIFILGMWMSLQAPAVWAVIAAGSVLGYWLWWSPILAGLLAGGVVIYYAVTNGEDWDSDLIAPAISAGFLVSAVFVAMIRVIKKGAQA